MSIMSLDLDDTPWIVCDPLDQAEIDDFIGKSGVDPAAVSQRAPTQREAAKLAAERIFRFRNGEEPEGLFGVSL